jgi:hypothetical protein
VATTVGLLFIHPAEEKIQTNKMLPKIINPEVLFIFFLL